MFYNFKFIYRGRRGLVEVFPAGVFVHYNGISCQHEAIRDPRMLKAIFKARMAL